MFKESTLYDQDTSIRSLCAIYHTVDEVIIESPFITEKQMSMFLLTVAKLLSGNVKITVNTRNPNEHDGDYYHQALNDPNHELVFIW